MTELPDIKLRALANFPVAVTGRTATKITKVNGQYFIDHDVSGLVQNPNISAGDVAASWMTIWNKVTNSYQNVPYALAATSGVSSIHGQTGALDIGSGLVFSGATLDQNLGDQINQYSTLTNAISAIIPSSVNSLRIFGRAAAGDCPPMFWTKLGSAPGTPRTWHFQNLHDLSWWVLTVGWFISPAMFATTAINSGIQDALDYLKTFGLTGGRVTCEPNKIYAGTAAPVVWNGLTLDGNGSKIESTLSGPNTYGLRVGDNAEFRNGWAHTIDGGMSSSQGIFGAGISLGVCNGSAGNLIGTPDYFAICRPRLRDVKASTARNGYAAIQIMGAVDFDIDGVEIPDSTACTGIHADWSDIGGTTVAASSGTDLDRLTKWRAAFDAGTVITTHPKGNIRRVRIGALTNTTVNPTSAIRLSACYNVTAWDVSIKECTAPVINHVGGDFAFEFAAADVKPHAYLNTCFGKISGNKCHNWGLYIDTFGDNLSNAITAGYVSLTPAITRGDIVVNGIKLIGIGAAGAEGIRLQVVKGVEVNHATVSGFTQGIGLDHDVENCKFNGGLITGNAFNGCSIAAFSTIKKVTFDGVDIQGNGTSGAGFAGFRISGGSGIVIDRCLLGADGETTQQYAVFVDSSAGSRVVSLTRNQVRDVKSAGTVFQLGAGGTDVIEVMIDNSYAGAATYLAGQTIIPLERKRVGAAVITRYQAAAIAMSSGVTPPSGPTYVKGDTVEIPDAASGAAAISQRGTSTWASLVNTP